MRNVILIIILSTVCLSLKSQTLGEFTEGKVSYVTSQNVYVKFQSTDNILKGDTLFVKQQGDLIPLLIVQDISSISAVCSLISEQKLSVGDQVFSTRKMVQAKKTEPQILTQARPITPGNNDSIPASPRPAAKTSQFITGSLAVSSYLNFSNVTANSLRMRYSFMLNAQNIGNSKLSAETYIDFTHKINEWNVINEDLFNGLKIYTLDLSYEFNKHNKVWLGRKINPRISNAGAIDGLQYELKLNSFTIGAIAGTRPDYRNYSFNANLLQYGGYLGHDLVTKKGSMQTTIAFIEQTYNGLTDRRFAYFQHANSLLPNLYFFGSVEVSLYKKVMNPVDTVQKDTTYKKDLSPTLSNLYLSIRYRPIRQLSLSVSYSSLQNIIYYETYPKNILERLLEMATVQGFMAQINYSPFKYLSFGVNAGYRDSKQDPKPSKNLYVYATASRIPGINASATISATFLETSYISGKIFGIGIYKDLVPGKLSGQLDYKYVSYNFWSGETSSIQNTGDLSLTWRILKKLSCSLYFEGTFEKQSIFNRVYINITQRF